jgi:hypothetical protein
MKIKSSTGMILSMPLATIDWHKTNSVLVKIFVNTDPLLFNCLFTVFAIIWFRIALYMLVNDLNNIK